jgi:hypothetical protein
MNLKQPVHTTMKNALQGRSSLFLLICLLFTQCSKTPDTPVTPKSSAKTLTSPTIDGITGASSSFDAATSTYTFTVPFGTDITALRIGFTLPTGATAKPASGSVQNFTNPVTYTVTAEDGSTQTYTVKLVITAAPKSSEKQITAFSFAALSPVVSATIDQTNRRIGATVLSSANLSALVPTITLSAKATVSPAPGVAQNFTNPVNYTVTAEDGSSQVYEVKVSQLSVIPTRSCLLTRLENSANPNEFVALEYTTGGRVSKIIKQGNFTGSANEVPIQADTYLFSYNAIGELTSLTVTQTKNNVTAQFEVKFDYNSGKFIGQKTYLNGVLQSPNPLGEWVVNDKNQIIEIKDYLKFTYTGDNVTTIASSGSSETITYDSKSHCMSGSLYQSIFATIWYRLVMFQSYLLPTPSMLNNPLKSSSTNFVVDYTYTYNKNGFPIESNTLRNGRSLYASVKYTYINCE